MRVLREKLIGALIGMARATDGNEHLINPSATNVIIKGLTASENTAVMEQLLVRAEEEKRKMVPDCFLCASPCGRTSDYDLTNLQAAEPAIRELKWKILKDASKIAEADADSYDERVLYKALIAVGMDELDLEDLKPIACEIGEVKNQCF